MYSCEGILVIRTICMYIEGLLPWGAPTLCHFALPLSLSCSPRIDVELHGQEVQGLKVHSLDSCLICKRVGCLGGSRVPWL